MQACVEQQELTIVDCLVVPGRFASRDRYMKRMEEFHCMNLQLHVIDDLHSQARIENMMMKATIFKIVHRSPPKFLDPADPGRALVVVELEHFLEMRHVVLTRIRITIFL